MKNFIERLEELKCYKPFTDHQKGFTDGILNAIRIYNELHPSTEIPAPDPEKQAKEGSFKVRITTGGYWYSEKVGEVFEVTEHDDCGTVKYCPIDYDPKYRYPKPSGLGLINKSDCEIIPETTVIPFDYDRWKSGDYLRVVTRNWRDVEQLVEFKCDDEFRLYGVIDNSVEVWRLDGRYKNSFDEYAKDLHLEIATPKPKQVTTYHWVDSTGYVRCSQTKEIVRKITTPVIGETITEQQPDGSFKIISTTLK